MAVPGRGAGGIGSGQDPRAGWEALRAVLGQLRVEAWALVGLGGPVPWAPAGIDGPRKPDSAAHMPSMEGAVWTVTGDSCTPSLGRGLQ